MKKKLFVNLVLILELAIFIVYGINIVSKNSLVNIIPLNYVVAAGSWMHEQFDALAGLIKIKELFTLLLGYNLNFVSVAIAFIAFNLAWIIVFYIIFGIIGAIIASSQKKKRRKLISEYKLTPSEEKRFSPVNYKKKAMRWIIWTFIVPILVIALFVIARFDRDMMNHGNLVVNTGIKLDIYTKYIVPAMNGLLSPLKFNDYFKLIFSNSQGIGYYDLVNKYLVSINWLEYVILVLGILLILFIWWGLFTLIALIFRNLRAKHLSKKAIKRYKLKMEKTEYKLRKKYNEEAVAKGDEFLKIIEEELLEDANEIAKIKDEKSKRRQKKIDAKKKAYLEEIGYGVVDLGVSEEKYKEEKEPLVEREIRYISDADIDIILEEEPVIEVVEEDDMEEVELTNKEDDLFFERYQEDDVDLELVEEHQPAPEDVMKYVHKKAEEQVEEPIEIVESSQEEIHVEEYQEEVVEEKAEEIVPEEPKQEVVEVEEKVEEPITPVIEETPKKNDPFAAYRNRVNKGHAAKKVQSFKDVGFKEDEMMVRDDGVKVSIKFDPFAKWRNKERKKGYGAKKVPSFKEIQAQKGNEELGKPASSKAKKVPPVKKSSPIKEEIKQVAKPKQEEVKETPKKNDPFAAYRNKPRKSTAAKKVESLKKEEPKVEEPKPIEEVKEAPKKNNPFAAYQNKPRASTAAKKVQPFKKEEPKAPEVKKNQPKKAVEEKNDPFAAYRYKMKEKQNASKK